MLVDCHDDQIMPLVIKVSDEKNGKEQSGLYEVSG